MGQARSFLTLGGSFFGNQRIALSVGLCGIGPALAGNVETGAAFALSHEKGLGVGPTYLHKRGHYNLLPAGDLLRL
jgi:hypothetical protein